MTCPHRRVLLCQGATPTRVRRPRPCHRRQVRSTQARVRVTSRSARPSRALARLLTGAGGGLVGSLRARRRVWCTRTRIRGSSHPCRHICRCTVVIAFPRLRQGDMTLSLRPLDRRERERDRLREYEERERSERERGLRERELERDARERERERERDRYERESVMSRSHAGSPELHRSASAGGRASAVPGTSLPPTQAPQAGAPGAPPPTAFRRVDDGRVPESVYVRAIRRDWEGSREEGQRGRCDDEGTITRVDGPAIGCVVFISGSDYGWVAGQFDASGGKDKMRRRGGRKRKDDTGSMGPSRAPSTQPPPFKVAPVPAGPHSKSPPSPDPISSASVSSGRSGRPSPTVSSAPRREVDEDYDEGAAGALMTLAQSGHGPPPVSPTAVSTGGGRSQPPHRGSISSAEGARRSPTIQTGMGERAQLKRPLSPGPGEPSPGESKRSRVEILNPTRRMASPAPQGRHTPQPSTPIPFRLQASRASEDARSPTTATSLTNWYPILSPAPSSAKCSCHIVPACTCSRTFRRCDDPPTDHDLSPSSSPSSGGARSPTTDSDRMQVDAGLGPASKSRSRSMSPPRAPPSASSSVPRSKVDVMNPSPTSAHSSGSGSGGAARKNSGSAGSPGAPKSPPTEKNGSPRS